MDQKAVAEGKVVFQTAILIAEPTQVNRILAELTGVGADIQSVQPIFMGRLDGEDVMITYVVKHESADAQFGHLCWVEDILAPFCKVY